MEQAALRQTIVDFFKSYEYSNLITIDESECPKGRMMENLPFGDDLVCWFATGAQSSKVQEIKNNSAASVFLYRPEDHSSISLQGEAQVVTDDAVRKEKWNDKWAAYWPAGPADEQYALIKIVPKKVVYLDWPNHSQDVLDL